MLINGQEVQTRYAEFGILNTSNGHVLDGYLTQQAAEFDALLYPSSVVVSREVYVTKWNPSGELDATVVPVTHGPSPYGR